MAPNTQSCGPTSPHGPAPNPPCVSCSPYIRVPATGPHWPQPGQGPTVPKCYLCTLPISFTPGAAGVAGQRRVPGRRVLCRCKGTVQPIFSPVISARLCPGSCQAQGGPPWCHGPQGCLSPCKSGWNIISSRALVPSIVWVETARDDSHKSCFFRKTREKSRGVV